MAEQMCADHSPSGSLQLLIAFIRQHSLSTDYTPDTKLMLTVKDEMTQAQPSISSRPGGGQIQWFVCCPGEEWGAAGNT